MAESLIAASPGLQTETFQRLFAGLSQLRQAGSAANAELADLISLQLKQASDLTRAADALRVLTAVVPEGTMTAQLVTSAVDKLSLVAEAREAAATAANAHHAGFPHFSL